MCTSRRFPFFAPFVTSVSSVLLSALLGCQSYEIVQSNIFADDNGNVVRVDYGRSDSDHVSHFRAPNGKELDFKTRLVVEVTLPDGDAVTAWQCMNMMGPGALYRTDDKEWSFHLTGFACSVYRRLGREGRIEYREVFKGICCETPKSDYEPNPKWRKLKKDAKGDWK